MNIRTIINNASCFVLVCILSFIFITTTASAETKTFIKEYTYQASEYDSKVTCRTLALEQVKRLLLEELGTYLESITEVKNFQLTKDQITTLTAGIVKTEIVEEKWDGRIYWLKSKITADANDVIKSIDALRKDQEKTKALEEVRKRSDDLLAENERLRIKLATATGLKRQEQKVAYNKTIKELAAIEWSEKGKKSAMFGRNEDAINELNKAIELGTKDVDSYFWRGYAHGRLGNYKQAISDYSKVIELNQKYAAKSKTLTSVYKNRGLAYTKLGYYRQAIRDYKKTIELESIDLQKQPKPGEPRDFLLVGDTEIAYYNMGNAYHHLGNYSQAIQNYKKAARLGSKEAQDDLRSKGIDW